MLDVYGTVANNHDDNQHYTGANTLSGIPTRTFQDLTLTSVTILLVKLSKKLGPQVAFEATKVQQSKNEAGSNKMVSAIKDKLKPSIYCVFRRRCYIFPN